MKQFDVGQYVRFWSKDECLEHNQTIGMGDISGQLDRFTHPWDTVVQIIGVNHYVLVRFPDGVELELNPVAISTDLLTEYQLATKILGEDYFGG